MKAYCYMLQLKGIYIFHLLNFLPRPEPEKLTGFTAWDYQLTALSTWIIRVRHHRHFIEAV